MENKCTILVNTCDNFSDVWELFFEALRRQWPECKYPVALNTESKKYSDENVQVINYLSYQGEDCWGDRLKGALEQISTPYVLTFLEDFVLEEKFENQRMIDDLIDIMDENPDIGVFYLHKHPNVIQIESEYPGFGLMPQKCEYKLTTQVGLWRTDFLKKCVKGIESPWEWELFVTKRAWKFKERMYALLDTQEEMFIYPWGGAIRRGLWNTEAIEIANKYGVDIDFDKRGIMDENDPFRLGNPYALKEHFPQDIITKNFWQEVNKRIKQKWRKFICSI